MRTRINSGGKGEGSDSEDLSNITFDSEDPEDMREMMQEDLKELVMG